MSGAWVVCYTDDGQQYYYNNTTNETSWEEPANFSQASSDNQSTWEQYTSENGDVYYYNSATGETSWENPNLTSTDYSQEQTPYEETPQQPIEEEQKESPPVVEPEPVRQREEPVETSVKPSAFAPKSTSTQPKFVSSTSTQPKFGSTTSTQPKFGSTTSSQPKFGSTASSSPSTTPKATSYSGPQSFVPKVSSSAFTKATTAPIKSSSSSTPISSKQFRPGNFEIPPTDTKPISFKSSAQTFNKPATNFNKASVSSPAKPPAPAVNKPAASPPVHSSASSPSIKFCIECGTAIQGKFCISCGAKVEDMMRKLNLSK